MSGTSTEQIMAKWYYGLFQVSNSSGTTETWKNPFGLCSTKLLNTSIITKLKKQLETERVTFEDSSEKTKCIQLK
jgi:hypothetical protein